MDRILSVDREHFVMALNDTAFVGRCNSKNLTELCPPTGNEDSTKDENKQELRQKSEESLREVHSVAISVNGSTILCAVSRGDKSLSLYQWDEGDENAPSTQQPSKVYQPPKRVSCMSFSKVDSIPILIGGDLTGDAYAYSLEGQSRRRHLLGHTASMLTGIRCVQGKLLLTADRDEKIRVSSFPETYVIQGFLLGHEQYVTAMDTTPDQPDLLVTCGGDRSLRTWNLQSMTEKSVFSLANEDESDSLSAIPTDLSLSLDGMHVAVIYDLSKRLDVYKLPPVGSDEKYLSLVQRIECPSQPLGIKFQSTGALMVALKDPDYLSVYELKEGASFAVADKAGIESLKARAQHQKLITLDTILEKDKYGNPKVQKLEETRGPGGGGDVPWNRVERIDIAKERTRRHKRRRKEKIPSSN